MFKGKKMPGQMGRVQVTTQNLEVVALDDARGLIMIKGAVPGSKGGYVVVRDARKKALPEGAALTPDALDSGAQTAEEGAPPAQADPAAAETSSVDAAEGGEEKPDA